MALDTAEKRRSAAGVPLLPLGPGVMPNASQPVAWRQESGWGYSGIEVGAPVVTTGGLVCGSATVTPRVLGTATIAPRVLGTAGLEKC